jgi:trimeric autotransporter adhesin
VKFHLNRFLRRVRIHGGEFDTSARAMYREGVTSSLRADLRIVRGSTIERKQMSTKTTFKRIALVTVAALGFGVMSVAPSNAAINQDTLTLSAATSAQTTAETSTSTAAVATVSFLGSTLDSMSVTASLVSGPAGNTALPVLSLVETASAYIDADTNVPADKGYAVLSNTAVKVVAADSTKVTTAKFRVFLGTGVTAGNDGVAAAVAPTVAGTYVVKLTPAAVSGSLAASTAQTLTITVTKAASQSTTASAASTVLLAKGETITSAVVDVDDVVTGSKSIVANSPIGSIVVTQYSATGVATSADGESITATITGAGLLGAGTQSDATTNSASATGRTILAKKGEVIAIFGDGTSGKGTITITTAAGLLLATKTVTFYDNTPTTLVATVKKAYPAAGKTTSKVFSVVVNDASANFVGNATVTAYPTDTATTVASQTAQACSLNATASAYDCPVLGGSSTKFGAVAYTVKAVGVDAAKTVVTGTASVTFADIIATSVTITGDATGTPGATVTYTLKAMEKNGYPVADTTYNGVESVGGSFWEEIETSGWSATGPFLLNETITTLSGVATSKGVLPIAGKATGTWTLKGDGTAAAGAIAKAISATDIVVSTDVTNPGVDAAAAAAEEATAAANDATDAALSAAEAAEAATAMAQEAVDAVAELSASVTKLISALRAQITTLTNLVVKIQKKVKA